VENQLFEIYFYGPPPVIDKNQSKGVFVVFSEFYVQPRM